MSSRRPSEEPSQLRIPDAAIGPPETEDRPELPLEERLERAAERFGDRVTTWEQQSLVAGLEPQLDRIDQWLGRIQKAGGCPGRTPEAGLAAAQATMDQVKQDEQEKAGRDAKDNPRVKFLSPERQEQRLRKNINIEQNKAVARHGAARWYDRPGNAERLNALHEAINRQRLGLKAA